MPAFFDAFRKLAGEAGDCLAAIDISETEDSHGIDTAGRPPARLTYAELHDLSLRLAQVISLRLEACRGKRIAEPCKGVFADVATFMRRGNSWYCTFAALVCLQEPVVALSTDLPDKATEAQRNGEIIREHRPLILIVDNAADLAPLRPLLEAGSTTIIRFSELWAEARLHAPCEAFVEATKRKALRADDVCGFQYTGGTTKASRCAIITHSMHASELATYPKITKLGRSDVVMQNKSLFWAASAIGEIDIALAFGSALLFCEAWDASAVATVFQRHGVTCAGIVPSILDDLQPADVPLLKVVFTWGEALKPRVARRWAKHVHLIDLLISTEYWLSFYADWTHSESQDSRPPFRCVPGVQVQLRQLSDEAREASSSDAGRGRVGELWMAGPMVCAGYTDAKFTDEAFQRDAGGVTWYNTKDCLEQLPDGSLRFSGRADDLVKAGGKWLDLSELEAKLAVFQGVAEICFCGTEAFVVCAEPLQPNLLGKLRLALPTDFELSVVPSIARHPATGKVDRRRLKCLMTGEVQLESSGGASLSDGSSCNAISCSETERCEQELRSLCRWYWPILVLVIASLLSARASVSFQSDSSLGDLRRSAGELILHLLPDLLLRLFCLSFMLLCRFQVREKHLTWLRYIPMDGVGLCMMASVSPRPVMLVLAVPGAILAAQRRRFISWHFVCLIGFPCWARDSAYFVQQNGVLRTLRWHGQELRKLFASFFTSLFGALGQRFDIFSCLRLSALRVVMLRNAVARCPTRAGITKTCNWCKRSDFRFAGRPDDTIDKFWYCSRCWEIYNRHRQCTKCGRWSSHVVDHAARAGGAGWEPVCFTCSKQSQPQQGVKRFFANLRSLSRVEEALGLDLPGSIQNGTASARSEDGSPLRKRRHVTGSVRQQENGLDNTASSNPDGAVPLFEDDEMEAAEPPAVRRRRCSELEVPEPPTARANHIEIDEKSEKDRRKCSVWRAVESVSGVSLSSRSEAMPQLDSLRSTKLQSALRRQTRRKVPRDTIRKAKSLDDLINEVDQTPTEREEAPDAAHGELEYAIWGMMWGSKCEWIVCRDRPLSQGVFHRALIELVQRHEVLRTELADPLQLFRATQQALTALELWRRYGANLLPARACRCVWRGVDALAGRCFRWSWPRIKTYRRGSASRARTSGCTTVFENALVLPRKATIEEAESAIWALVRPFTPPFRAMLAPYGKEEEEGALVYLAVSHMLADGYSVVPLIKDLAELAAQAEVEQEGGRANLDLPPAPATLALTEARLMRTVELCGTDLLGTAPDRGLITREPVKGRGPWNQQDTATDVLDLSPEFVAILREGARRLAVPEDVALLTVVALALGWFHGCRSQPFVTIVPQRDGDAEQDMVGLLADFRRLTLHTGGLNFAGAALLLHRTVRERLWTETGLATQNDAPMVNCMWTDFDSPHGFTQQFRPNRRRQFSRYPLQVSVEQSGIDLWHLSVTFRLSSHSQAEQDRFFFLLEESLLRLCRRPLDPLWPCPREAQTRA
eukprot:TRINITY_DN37486_c0_g1_i1.p1 TRINITY_DN37486_c0_g1~~TRINITY_DN37486_c0_g1_i1.p1  ORF type:complete len:1502 (-),score=300.09 TRINITY_DN37486_c0_g1_i1:46-4551(-)